MNHKIVETPELLLRTTVFEEYLENSVEITIDEAIDFLKNNIGVWWNAYALPFGFKVKPFPHPARNGYFVDIETRYATHRFISNGIVRRDQLLKDKGYEQIVHPKYLSTWNNVEDALRTYSVLISEIKPLQKPIPIENFGLFLSWGKISKNDNIKRPRLIKSTILQS